MGEKRLAKMGKRRRQTYKNTFSAQRSCKLDTVTGQGKMVLVREKSGKSHGILISHFCGNNGASVVWHPLLPLMNSFNNFEAAQTMLPRDLLFFSG